MDFEIEKRTSFQEINPSGRETRIPFAAHAVRSAVPRLRSSGARRANQHEIFWSETWSLATVETKGCIALASAIRARHLSGSKSSLAARTG